MNGDGKGSAVARGATSGAGGHQDMDGMEIVVPGSLQALFARQAADLAVADPGADRIRLQAADVAANLDTVVTDFLARSGLGARERGARADMVPTGIVAAIRPHGGLDGMLGADHGFGLSGAAGAGKTMALAVMAARAARARLTRAAERDGWAGIRASRWMSWVAWPDAVRRMRATVGSDGGMNTVNAWCDRWIMADVLVLDDVGAERISTTYSDDWATSMLDAVLDMRERRMAATWYTTNLDRAGMLDRYGSRLFSRLCGEQRNPLVVLPRLADMRNAARRA